MLDNFEQGLERITTMVIVCGGGVFIEKVACVCCINNVPGLRSLLH